MRRMILFYTQCRVAGQGAGSCRQAQIWEEGATAGEFGLPGGSHDAHFPCCGAMIEDVASEGLLPPMPRLSGHLTFFGSGLGAATEAAAGAAQDDDECVPAALKQVAGQAHHVGAESHVGNPAQMKLVRDMLLCHHAPARSPACSGPLRGGSAAVSHPNPLPRFPVPSWVSPAPDSHLNYDEEPEHLMATPIQICDGADVQFSVPGLGAQCGSLGPAHTGPSHRILTASTAESLPCSTHLCALILM